jgi:outer membrane immunogenic protein
MKSLLITASAAVAMLVAAPAFAQSIQPYGTLGYTDENDNGANASAITGRLGARFGRYFGVEGEGGFGVGGDRGDFHGLSASINVHDEYGGYGVGFLPITHHLDLIGRVGYGAVDSRVNLAAVSFDRHDSGVAFGGGAQYFFDHANGIRADYTRQEYGPLDHQSNVWAMAYVRKF